MLRNGFAEHLGLTLIPLEYLLTPDPVAPHKRLVNGFISLFEERCMTESIASGYAASA